MLQSSKAAYSYSVKGDDSSAGLKKTTWLQRNVSHTAHREREIYRLLYDCASDSFDVHSELDLLEESMEFDSALSSQQTVDETLEYKE